MIDPSASVLLWLAAGAYAPTVDQQALEPLLQPAPGGAFNGVRFSGRSAAWEAADPTDVSGQSEFDLRLFADDRGVLAVDQLRFETGIASVRVRELLGDRFDLALLGGQWDTPLTFVDSGPTQILVYAPTLLTLVGLSNTDFDPDRRLKHYLAAGLGPGARVHGVVAGRLEAYAHAEGIARSFTRYQRDADRQVRHELAAEASAGLGWGGGQTRALFGGWAEVVSQWESRDADGLGAVDRQYTAMGVSLTVLTHPERAADLDVPLGTGDLIPL